MSQPQRMKVIDKGAVFSIAILIMLARSTNSLLHSMAVKRLSDDTTHGKSLGLAWRELYLPLLSSCSVFQFQFMSSTMDLGPSVSSLPTIDE